MGSLAASVAMEWVPAISRAEKRVMIDLECSRIRFDRSGGDSRNKPGSALLASLIAPSPPLARLSLVAV